MLIISKYEKFSINHKTQQETTLDRFLSPELCTGLISSDKLNSIVAQN